jgi:hypothetical protein
MLYSTLAHVLALVLDLLTLPRRSDQAKDLQILALRQQPRILQSIQPPARPTRGPKLLLAVIASKLKQAASRAGHPWSHNLLLVSPATGTVGECRDG